jgi:glycosyltransferase involved in cell wall biosynthesis
MNPDVSVIIANYNRLNLIPRAIDSCRNQSCSIEIIVVDDHSNDGSWEWLQSQPDIISVRNEINSGQPFSINRGMALATGRYFKFLDSDDFLNKNTLHLQVIAGDEQQADIVISRCDEFHSKTQTIVERPEAGPWEDFTARQLGADYGSHMSAMIFKKELAIQVPRRADAAFMEDRMAILEMCLRNPKIAYLPGCTGYWVFHEQQMTNFNKQGMSTVVSHYQYRLIFKRILTVMEERNMLTPLRKKAACERLWILAEWIAKHHLHEALEIENWIYSLCPDFKPQYAGITGTLYKNIGFKKTQQLLTLRRNLLKLFI